MRPDALKGRISTTSNRMLEQKSGLSFAGQISEVAARTPDVSTDHPKTGVIRRQKNTALIPNPTVAITPRTTDFGSARANGAPA